MQIAEIISQIEKVAPPSAQAGWDCSGLQVAAERDFATRMAVMLDPLPDLVQTALEHGANFILAHHPLALKAGLPNRVDNYFRVLKLLMRANVPLYSAHTSLDANPAGPAAWLAESLELRDRECLEHIGGNPGETQPGYGMAGNLPEPLPFRILMERVLELLGLDSAVMCGPDVEATISRLAFCGGSGSSMAHAAWEAGAQLFITGDVKHHAALDAPLPVMDVGHHSMESRMMDVFAAKLSNDLPSMEVFYLPSVSPFRLVSREN